ncbi:unnamed protein product, partial [Didymodactylos carnosus]
MQYNSAFAWFSSASEKYMDVGGRVYKDWDDYLRNNHLPQGVMIYPKDGTYTPENANSAPEERVTLIAQETHSCKPSARVKNFFDKVVMVTGLALTATALVTAVPLGIFAASTLATISTGSYYAGLACTAYSVSTNGYDKFTHDESVTTELLLIGTTALSGFTMYLNQSWSKIMAEHVQKMDSWDDVVLGISRTQKIIFATLNVIKVVMSASSLFLLCWNLWMKKNRTWFDYYQFCVSLFFFANAVTKPITLQGVFESEQGKYIENNIRTRVERDEAHKELDKAVNKAKTTQQKTYLIRNLQKIHDLDGHFYRVHQTGSIIEYTERGLIVNNQLTLSPEAYNQMGKEQLLQKLNDIKLYPTEEERNKQIEGLLADYESQDFKKYVKDYIEGNMNDDQQAKFNNNIEEMAIRRKDQFFRDTAKFKNTPQYRESMKIEREKNLTAWKEERIQLDTDKQSGKINLQQYDSKVKEIKQKAERTSQLHKTIDKYVQNPSLDRKTIVDDYVKKHAGGKTEEQWSNTHTKLEDQYNELLDHAKDKADKRFQDNKAAAKQGEQMAREAKEEINVSLNKPLVEGTRDIYKTTSNYERNESFVWNVTEDNTKSSIEEIWGIPDYRAATVNGQTIFKDLDINGTDEVNCIINSCGKNAGEAINFARRLAEDPACQMKADNAREFGHVINAVRQVGKENLANMNYDTLLNKINTMYNEAANIQLSNGQTEYTSINSAAVHAYKHKSEWGEHTTTKEYLTTIADTIIQPKNATGSVYTQNGRGISTNYGVTESGRYRFGVTRSDPNGNSPRIVTLHVRSDAGVINLPTSNATTNNFNGNNPGNNGSNLGMGNNPGNGSNPGLQLTITEAVYATDVGLSLSELFKQLFGVNAYDNVSNTLKTFVHRHYINQLKGFIRHFGKKHIYEQLKEGSTIFIKRFEQQKSLRNLFNDVARIQLRINYLLNEDSEGSLFTEFSRYFNRLRNRFVPIQVEENFRLALIEWFRSGEMTKKIRSELNNWFQNGASLNKFKHMSLSIATSRDSHRIKVINFAQQINTDEFMQPKNLKKVLSKFLAPTIINVENGRIRLRGRTIFLSDWIDDIIKKCNNNSDLDVEIYATDCCGIDCNINLYGINLVICSNTVYIWQKHTIVLSGLSYKPGKPKAVSAQNNSKRGSDGTDGLPGYSSGNFYLFATEMVNPPWLSVFLNGGRGQDGGDGGDGYNGKDGIGITQNELDNLCVKYSSLYFNWWETFQGYSAPSNWNRTCCKWDRSKQFGYEEFTDEHGRIIKYSFAGDVGWVYTTYHLYFIVVGSEGTAGTQGGSNGVGGEGGYRGICKAENPETGKNFPINIERKMGQNGIDGVVGKSG